MTISVVMRGSYSAYRIVGIFDDVEVARQIVSKFDEEWDTGRVESSILNELAESVGCCGWLVRMTGAGEMSQRYKADEAWENPTGHGQNTSGWYFYVLAQDEAHARKIANDRWASVCVQQGASA